MLQTAPGTLANDHDTASWAKDAFVSTPRAIDPLAGHGLRIAVKRGQEIFAEGDAAESCYRLAEGSIRLVKLMADGRRQVCEFLKAGDLLGFETDEEYYFSAEAVNDCTLMRYPRRAVETLLAEDKLFARHVRKVTVRGLQGAYQRMVLLCHKSAQERIAWFLLDVADRAGLENGYIHLPMTRTDIANYLGMAIETVSRVLGQFKQNGALIQKSLNRIQIVDRNALELVRGEV
ncbi:MAG: helix-turn-helix domain-containing protein [Rhodospirillaceae bacterium]